MAARFSRETYERLLRVTVAGNESTAVVGRWVATDTTLEFRPSYPFDRGRAYAVRVDPSRLIPPRSGPIFDSIVSLSAGDRTPVTSVIRTLPSSDVLPENLLRFYIEFSAPMSREGGLAHVKLLDDSGADVAGAFLPLEADFWNQDRTRYTLFLDPGRVKRGILPNEQMGRAIVAGRRYTLAIDSLWRDAMGLPLRRSYRRSFRGGPADEQPVSLASWRVTSPAAGTRDPLIVTFDEPVDHGLLHRALGVTTARGRVVTGETEVATGEMQWRFRPRDPWQSGPHHLVVLAILEDPSGNRIGRAFEADRFDHADSSGTERHVVPFTVGAARR